MGNKDREGQADQGGNRQGQEGQADELPDRPEEAPIEFPPQSPLFHAQHSQRYERQGLIRTYEERFNCRLAVLKDVIFPEIITLFEELIADADPEENLHLMLDTPGGDGESAIRLVRSAQARCAKLTVIVPNQAKSAGTLLAMGAHEIMMGPTSDLGPVDPQFQAPEGRGLYSAKDLIAAVNHAEEAIADNPDSYPLYVSLLADVNAIMVEQARSALTRSSDLVKEALRSNPDREEDEVEWVAAAVKEKLIDLSTDHGAVFDSGDAEEAELPVTRVNPSSDQWKLIWQLWTKYFALYSFVAEGRFASQVRPMFHPDDA